MLPTASVAPPIPRVSRVSAPAMSSSESSDATIQREPPAVPHVTAPPTPMAKAVVPSSIDTPSGVRRSTRSTKGIFQKPRYMDEVYLSALDLSGKLDAHRAQLAYLAELYTCPDSGILNISDPRVYAAKLRGNDSDNPTFQQAMHGSDAAEYIKGMKLETHTLVGQRTWESFDRPKHQNVLKGTWAFKLKRLPDGTAYRHKARFCARGELRKEGVDFFETYAPVVQWSTIRLLLSTVLTEGWTTRQLDYTNAFAQAELKEEVYVE